MAPPDGATGAAGLPAPAGAWNVALRNHDRLVVTDTDSLVFTTRSETTVSDRDFFSRASEQFVHGAPKPLNAVAGTHFAEHSGRVTFRPGEVEKPLRITLIGDGRPGWTRRFYLTLEKSSDGMVRDPDGYDRDTLDDSHFYTIHSINADPATRATVSAPASAVEGEVFKAKLSLTSPTDSKLNCWIGPAFMSRQASTNDMDISDIGADGAELIVPTGSTGSTESREFTLEVKTDNTIEAPEP